MYLEQVIKLPHKLHFTQGSISAKATILGENKN